MTPFDARNALPALLHICYACLMQPNTNNAPVTPGPSAPPDNPYKFILDTEHQPKKSMSVTGKSAFKTKIFAVLGLGILLIIVIVAVNALFFNKENNATKLSSLAAEQTEIIRVADLGLKTATDGDVKGFAETARLSVQSHLNLLKAYLTKNSVELTPLILKSKLNSKTDAALTSAAAANRYDEVFKETLKTELKSYAVSIQASYKTASNETSKKLLSDMYDSIETLLK